jgi:hypothetical protein
MSSEVFEAFSNKLMQQMDIVQQIIKQLSRKYKMFHQKGGNKNEVSRILQITPYYIHKKLCNARFYSVYKSFPAILSCNFTVFCVFIIFYETTLNIITKMNGTIQVDVKW